MAKEITLPDGSVGEFPDSMSDDDIKAVLVKQFPAPKAAPRALPKAAAGPTKESLAKELEEQAPWYEKAATGYIHGLKKMGYGLKDLVGAGSEEDKADVKEMEDINKTTGAWGTAGELLGEGLVTAPLGGGAAMAGGKLIGRALPTVAKLANKGGRILNPATAAKMITEGAVGGAIPMPGEGESRTENAAAGGLAGLALPAVGKLVTAPVRALYGQFAPTAGQAARRAAETLERTLGRGEVERIANKAEAELAKGPRPGGLPKTTAALVDEAKVGNLERGARARGEADFLTHDAQVADQAAHNLEQATAERGRVGLLEGRSNKIMDSTKSMFHDIKLPDQERAAVFKRLSPYLDSDEVLARPQLRNELQRALNVLGDPDTPVTAEILPQLYWSVKELGKGSDTGAVITRVLQQHADNVSGGLLTRANQAASKQHRALEKATAAKKLSEEFVSPEGFSMTGTPINYQGSMAPPISAAKLSSAAGEQANLAPETVAKVKESVNELRKHELYKPKGVGTPELEKSKAEDALIGAVRAGGGWQTLPIVKSLYAAADKSTQKVIDEALLDPNKFVAMARAKALRGGALKPWEQKLLSTMETAAGTMGAAYPGE